MKRLTFRPAVAHDDAVPTNPTSTTTTHGWHHATISDTAAANGCRRTYKLTWRTQRSECCASQPLIVWDETTVPATVDPSWGKLQDRWQQCGGCGRVHRATYTFREGVSAS